MNLDTTDPSALMDYGQLLTNEDEDDDNEMLALIYLLTTLEGQNQPSSNHQQSHESSSAPKRKKGNPWSREETMALVEGVRLVGVGNWAEIKKLPVPAAEVLKTRTSVDLKDKWRNLTRLTSLPVATLRARLKRVHSVVPLETVMEVRRIMEAGQGQEEHR